MTLPKPNTQPPRSALVLHNLPKIAAESDKFRRVLFTGKHSQLVIMTVPVGGEIGEETHSVDQHLYFVSGTAQVITDGKKKEDIASGDHVVIPAGTLTSNSQFVNIGPTPLIVTTVYAPAEHKADTVHDTLEQGEKLEDEGKDEPPKWAKE